MANITINELQPAEFAELSDLELEGIVGGKKGLFGSIDKFVRDNLGGWKGLADIGLQLIRIRR